MYFLTEMRRGKKKTKTFGLLVTNIIKIIRRLNTAYYERCKSWKWYYLYSYRVGYLEPRELRCLDPPSQLHRLGHCLLPLFFLLIFLLAFLVNHLLYWWTRTRILRVKRLLKLWNKQQTKSKKVLDKALFTGSSKRQNKPLNAFSLLVF